MIDPENITNYNRTEEELHEFFLFSILVAGKKAKTIAAAQERFFDLIGEIYPEKLEVNFYGARRYTVALAVLPFEAIAMLLKRAGIGCHTAKARTIREAFNDIWNRKLNLQTCDPARLELYYGIGPKTARFFILHSRRDALYAVLDTHILRWMRAQGWAAPKATPTGKKYFDLEKKFLDYCRDNLYTPAQLDLIIWTAYSQNPQKRERKP